MNVQTTASGASAALDVTHLGITFSNKPRYGNSVGGKFVEPRSGQWFENVTPADPGSPGP